MDSVGGAFSDSSATWRWAFYINLCIGAAFAPIYLYHLPKADPQAGTEMGQKLRQLDFPGIVLNIGAFTSLVMALTFGGTEFSWSDGREIALWVVSGVLILCFAIQQIFTIGTTPETRLFPVDFLQKRIMWILYMLMSAAATCVFVGVFLHLDRVRD